MGGEDDRKTVSECVARAEKIGVSAVPTDSNFTRERVLRADENRKFGTQPLFTTRAPTGQHAEFILAPA